MSYVESAWSHANIPAELANVRPLGDFCLVRMLPEEEMHRNLIWLPQFSGAHADRQLRPTLPSIGEVVAAGPGDRLEWLQCGHCGKRISLSVENHSLEELTNSDVWTCPHCQLGRVLFRRLYQREKPRHMMHVSPGDRIMYWRVPANEVVLNDETFQFLHEQQHVLGVIEDG